MREELRMDILAYLKAAFSLAISKQTPQSKILKTCMVSPPLKSLEELFRLGFKCEDSQLPVRISELEADVLEEFFLAGDKTLEQNTG